MRTYVYIYIKYVIGRQVGYLKCNEFKKGFVRMFLFYNKNIFALGKVI